ncbi:unnamed protein product [Jaminaea pallidilutea]
MTGPSVPQYLEEFLAIAPETNTDAIVDENFFDLLGKDGFSSASVPDGTSPPISAAASASTPQFAHNNGARRRAQNRKSQRAHRKRKAEQEADLRRDFTEMRDRCDLLEVENERLRQLLSTMHLSPRNTITSQDLGPLEMSSSSDSASVPSLRTASSLSDAMRQKLDRSRNTSGLSLDPCILLPPHAANEDPMDQAKYDAPGSSRHGKGRSQSDQMEAYRDDQVRDPLAMEEAISNEARPPQNINYSGRLETAALYLNPGQPEDT